MLAAVAARGCSSALTATAATAAVAEAEAEATSTGAGAARAESASRGCLRLIAPTQDFFSHFPVLFLLFFFLHSSSSSTLSLVVCLSVSLAFRSRYSRDERVCYAHNGGAFREESS